MQYETRQIFVEILRGGSCWVLNRRYDVPHIKCKGSVRNTCHGPAGPLAGTAKHLERRRLPGSWILLCSNRQRNRVLRGQRAIGRIMARKRLRSERARVARSLVTVSFSVGGQLMRRTFQFAVL